MLRRRRPKDASPEVAPPGSTQRKAVAASAQPHDSSQAGITRLGHAAKHNAHAVRHHAGDRGRGWPRRPRAVHHDVSVNVGEIGNGGLVTGDWWHGSARADDT